jgi:hypothetical protein
MNMGESGGEREVNKRPGSGQTIGEMDNNLYGEVYLLGNCFAHLRRITGSVISLLTTIAQ